MFFERFTQNPPLLPSESESHEKRRLSPSDRVPNVEQVIFGFVAGNDRLLSMWQFAQMFTHVRCRAPLYIASMTVTRAAASLGVTSGWSFAPATAAMNW